MPCLESAPTGALKPRKPPPSLPRDGQAGHECGFALSHNLKTDRNGPWSAVRTCARHGEQKQSPRLAGELLVLAAHNNGHTRARGTLNNAGDTPRTLWGSRVAQESEATMPDGSSDFVGVESTSADKYELNRQPNLRSLAFRSSGSSPKVPGNKASNPVTAAR